MDTIYTIGHSNKSLSEFLQKLEEKGIDTLVDVRTFPRSRFCPWFNERSLSEKLPKKGISYLGRGSSLGGRGVNTAYEETIDEVVQLVKSGKKVSVMCSEGDYRSCHRLTMLTPSLQERGLGVEHIQHEKRAK